LKSSKQILHWGRFPINTRNLKVVALSIVAATTFWFFNALNKDYSATIKHPVVFEFDRTQYIETDELPDRIEINVSGIGWSIFRSGYLFNTEPIFIKVENPERDNKLLGSGLFSQLSEGLSNLTLNYVLDDTITLNAELIMSKRTKLVVDSSSIQMQRDYYIISPISLSVDSVTVTGPRSFISQMGDSLYVNISERDINRSFSKQLPVLIDNNFVTVDSTSTNVDFEVERYINVKKLVTLTKVNFPEDSLIALMDSSILVSYYIRESYVQEAEENYFVIVADFDRMVQFDSTIQPLILQHPENIKDLKIDPPRAQVVKNN
jgi:hypothetical protein